MSVELSNHMKNNKKIFEKNYKITVIIPCYNCENTLNRAVNSVINQSFGFENIELILYDDFSTDSTRLLIKNYSEKYENIIPILSNENSGYPGKGRNEGIKKASSEFIMFMDNDDEYDKEICKNLYNEITSQNCDLVSCNFLNIDEFNKIHINYNYHFGEEIGNKVIFHDKNTIYFPCRLVWACIIKKKIILNNNIKFPEDNLSEDVYFLSIYNLYSKKTIYLKEYSGINRYVQHDSHSNSLTITKINRQFDVFDMILEKYKLLDCDLSLIFGDIVDTVIFNLYHTNSVKENKNSVYPVFERLRNFMTNINYIHSNNIISNIAIKLILKKHFYLTKKYLTLINFIDKTAIIIKLYNLFKS